VGGQDCVVIFICFLLFFLLFIQFPCPKPFLTPFLQQQSVEEQQQKIEILLLLLRYCRICDAFL